MPSELEILQEYVQTRDKKSLTRLSTQFKEILTDHCFRVLYQKNGNHELAREILYNLYHNCISVLPENSLYLQALYQDPVIQLERFGACTIPLLPQSDLKQARGEFQKTLLSFPEYRNDNDNNHPYVLNNFAALGNPSSFHNPFVRNLRIEAYKKVVPIFKSLLQRRYKNKDMKLEMLWDRMMYRMKGMKATPESWHRDVMPRDRLDPDDKVYGGWINLDHQDQYFSFLPGTHLGYRQYDMTPRFAELDKKVAKQVSKFKYKLSIPPGHILIFPQYILHELQSSKATTTMMRLFLGWRTTTRSTSIYGEKKFKDIVTNQAVPPLPGGIIPPMYVSNHARYYMTKRFRPNPYGDLVNLPEWCQQTFIPSLLITTQKGNKLIDKHMGSLRYYNLPMYPEYTDDEVKLYQPHFI